MTHAGCGLSRCQPPCPALRVADGCRHLSAWRIGGRHGSHVEHREDRREPRRRSPAGAGPGGGSGTNHRRARRPRDACQRRRRHPGCRGRSCRQQRISRWLRHVRRGRHVRRAGAVARLPLRADAESCGLPRAALLPPALLRALRGPRRKPRPRAGGSDEPSRRFRSATPRPHQRPSDLRRDGAVGRRCRSHLHLGRFAGLRDHEGRRHLHTRPCAARHVPRSHQRAEPRVHRSVVRRCVVPVRLWPARRHGAHGAARHGDHLDRLRPPAWRTHHGNRHRRLDWRAHRRRPDRGRAGRAGQWRLGGDRFLRALRRRGPVEWLLPPQNLVGIEPRVPGRGLRRCALPGWAVLGHHRHPRAGDRGRHDLWCGLRSDEGGPYQREDH